MEFFIDVILPGGQGEVLTTLPPSCADCLVIWEPRPLRTFRTCPGLYRDFFFFFAFVRSKFVIRIKWIISNNNSVINLLNRKPIQYESRLYEFCSQMMFYIFLCDLQRYTHCVDPPVAVNVMSLWLVVWIIVGSYLIVLFSRSCWRFWSSKFITGSERFPGATGLGEWRYKKHLTTTYNVRFHERKPLDVQFCIRYIYRERMAACW